MAYINGQFVASILLAQAHIEHNLQGYVARPRRASPG